MIQAFKDDRVVGNVLCRHQTMSARPPFPSQALAKTILRSVSRSFYLSIRFLPQQLREPIALAYLLARTTDTVADTTRIPGTVRMEALKMLSDGIQGKVSREVVINHVASFVPLQENAAEQTLLDSLPDCLKWLEQIGEADRRSEERRVGKESVLGVGRGAGGEQR